MDGKRFDELSRLMATRHSRRRLFGLLGAAGAVLANESTRAAPRGDKPTKCYGEGSQCTNAKQCCSGNCLNRQCTAEVVTPQCTVAADCPGTGSECQLSTCAGGVCGVAFAGYGTPVSQQTAGDCQRNVCDGVGGVTALPDDTDVPAAPNECTNAACSAGIPSYPPLAAGTSCGENGDLVCDGSGQCVVCVPGSQRSCYSGPEGTDGIGVCQAGLETCASDGSGYGACEGEILPSTETCNGLDDDCNGLVDDNAPCAEIANGIATCVAGQCIVDSCNPGFADCDADPTSGCETDVMTDPTNCGACGQDCVTWTGNASAVCSGTQGCCANPGYGSICCGYGTYKPSVCSYQSCYSCGPFGKSTCCDTYYYSCCMTV